MQHYSILDPHLNKLLLKRTDVFIECNTVLSNYKEILPLLISDILKCFVCYLNSEGTNFRHAF